MSNDVLNDVFLRCVFERHDHRFVVDCGKASLVAIFLLPMPAVATFSMAKSSCADKTILVVKMLTNTSDLSQMWLYCTACVWSRCCASM